MPFYAIDRHARRFFYSEFSIYATRFGGPFSYPRHARRTSKNHRAFQGGAYGMVSVTFSVGWSPPGAGSPTKRKSHDVWYFQKENPQGHY
ncbi:hypothetical protein F0D89_01635 [Escherichia coli]|nr:hypothetical protein [Escherichia coli]EEW2508132.1 hypothetical protein [Escherichia coli]EEW2572828.1 hypothetical protein [Escherichia coli]EEX2904532.1 hypothetical protein [Escherichia coli]EEY6188128.1 hypothetical protein [Escherichia coli]